MLAFIIYFLAAFGLAYIVGHSQISVGFRRWLGGTPAKLDGGREEPAKWIPAKPGALGAFGDFICALIECPACFGFWIGLGCGIAQLIAPPFELHAFAWTFLLACATSGSNFILSRLTELS